MEDPARRKVMKLQAVVDEEPAKKRMHGQPEASLMEGGEGDDLPVVGPLNGAGRRNGRRRALRVVDESLLRQTDKTRRGDGGFGKGLHGGKEEEEGENFWELILTLGARLQEGKRARKQKQDEKRAGTRPLL